MHLHGFYFDVESRGDGSGDTQYGADTVDRVVTESMSPGTTMGITWIPERAGNWLFHCHLPEHFGPRGPLGLPPAGRPMTHHPTSREMPHAMGAMNGLVVGIKVGPGPGQVIPRADGKPARRLRLLVRRNAGGSDPASLFLLTGVLGGFTTFSAFSLDAVQLWQRGAMAEAAAYVLASVLFSITAVVAGFTAVRAMS